VLNRYLEENNIKEEEVFNLFDLDVKHCTGCLSCFKTGECIIKDDMEKLYDAANRADVLVFTTPVYFNSVTSIGKTIIDRFQRNYARRFIRFQDPKVESQKKGVLIMTAGSGEKNNSFDGVRKPLDLFFKSNGIIGFEEILFQGLDHK
jgi:multimeric flavodoxin WrbA